MNQHSMIIVLLLMLLVGGIYFPGLSAPTTSVDQPSLQQLEKTLGIAEQLRAKAQALGFEWTTIGPLIRSAHQLRDQGKLREATHVASEAILHCKLAIEQANDAQKNWQLETP